MRHTLIIAVTGLLLTLLLGADRATWRERIAQRRGEAASDLKRMTWKIGEDTREALVYFPKTQAKDASERDARTPIVFAFHGHGGRAEYAARKLDIHSHWPEAICVYPQGLPTPAPKVDPEGKKNGWQKSVGDQDDRDLKFFDAMLKTFVDEHHADAKRIYSTGHSNGGFFTYVLLAARGDKLAAIAPIAATLSRDWKNAVPKPVLHVAGEKDPLVKFDAQQRTIDAVRKLNGCDDVPGVPAGEHCTRYQAKGGFPVIAFLHDGGHEIPDGAVERIAAFFKEH